MEKETRNCKNCKNAFVVDDADVEFYKKINVPAPTFCPECRMIRRMLVRNERALYKRNCDKCKKPMITMYAPESPYVVYCAECYQSDGWDPLSYGRDVDFSKTFTEQRTELMRVVPRRALYLDFAVNSEYAGMGVYLKNCYLVFGGHHYEDTMYAAQSFYLTNCVDVDFSKHCEQCYGSVHLARCNNVYNSLYSEDCSDSNLLYGCRNCSNCVGCVNLRNSSYCIFNEQYSKEDFEKKIKSLRLGTYSGFRLVLERFKKHALQFPRKFASTRNAIHSTGDDLEQVKNCVRCFSATEDEDVRYSFFVPTGAKDCYDLDHCGLGTELTYELHSGFGNNHVAFGNRVYYSHDTYYSDDCYNAAYLFGCIGLKKKEYCILNKQYTKEEYEQLMEKMIAHMRETKEWGEFFPASIAPFAYNETTAQEYFPLTKAEAIAAGYRWRDPEAKNYQISIKAEDLSDGSDEYIANGVAEIIGCEHEGKCNEQCTLGFRLLPQELQFYKTKGLPLPRRCPNCRHYERLRLKNPLKLWNGKCKCAGEASEGGVFKNTAKHFHNSDHCPNIFETSYAPDRSEIVYCEQCYQAEVV